MDKEEFVLLTSTLTNEQLAEIIETYNQLLNAHDPQKTRLKSA